MNLKNVRLFVMALGMLLFYLSSFEAGHNEWDWAGRFAALGMMQIVWLIGSRLHYRERVENNENSDPSTKEEWIKACEDNRHRVLASNTRWDELRTIGTKKGWMPD